MENQYNYYHSEEPQNDSSYSSQPNPEHHEKPKKKMPKAVVVTGCALLFGVVSSATFLTTNVVGNKVLGLDQKAAKEVSNTTQNKATLTKTSSVVTSDVSSVVESVMPSIVSITNMSVQQVQSFFGGTSQQEVTSAGTGIIIEKTDSELLIVTNNHVVADSNQLTVTFDDQSSVEADIKGTDSAHDLAVIAVQLDKISSHPDIDGMIGDIERGDLLAMTQKMGNVFEPGIIEKYPVIGEIKALMESHGALKAMMSGSGPTVFGIFDDREKMEAAAEVLRESRLAKTVFATEVTKAGGNTNDK
jgi:hypothetical protein